MLSGKVYWGDEAEAEAEAEVEMDPGEEHIMRQQPIRLDRVKTAIWIYTK